MPSGTPPVSTRISVNAEATRVSQSRVSAQQPAGIHATPWTNDMVSETSDKLVDSRLGDSWGGRRASIDALLINLRAVPDLHLCGDKQAGTDRATLFAAQRAAS